MSKWWNKKSGNEPKRRRLSSQDSHERRQQEQTEKSLFRRNRTLIGSLSARVSSANELGGDLQSSRTHVHHLNAHRRALWSVLLVVMVSAGICIWLLYQFTAKIDIVASDGSLVVQEDRYRDAFDSYFAAHPAERLRFLVNDDALTRHVAQTASEVENIRTSGSSGFATGQFSLTFRKPIAGWLIGTTQYYVDNKGISFQKNYYTQPSVKIVDNSGVPQSAGATIASSRFLRFVGHAVAYAKQNGITIREAIIPVNTTHQIEMVTEGYEYPVKLSLDRPVGEQIEDMQRALSYFDQNNVSPQYIDVRVSGKAYYR